MVSYKTVTGEVKQRIRNTVDNTVITMCGTRWVLEILEDHFVIRRLSGHYAVHLKPTQNNIDYKL